MIRDRVRHPATPPFKLLLPLSQAFVRRDYLVTTVRPTMSSYYTCGGAPNAGGRTKKSPRWRSLHVNISAGRPFLPANIPWFHNEWRGITRALGIVTVLAVACPRRI